jgi:Fe-Mn family superoxide dismutase
LSTPNSPTPLTLEDTALLTCVVCEHAFYIVYRNARPKYVEAWWNTVNWDFASKNF